jgi:hypothetical protein
MKNLILITALIVCLFSVACVKDNNEKSGSIAADSTDNMDGWFKAGSKPGFYNIGTGEERYEGNKVYYIQSTEDMQYGFGTIMRHIEPGEYAGKRIMLSGYIKAQSVSKSAGMWMRIDGRTPGVMLGFDNMNDRPIQGTTDWQKYEIVLDVPDSSAAIVEIQQALAGCCVIEYLADERGLGGRLDKTR